MHLSKRLAALIVVSMASFTVFAAAPASADSPEISTFWGFPTKGYSSLNGDNQETLVVVDQTTGSQDTSPKWNVQNQTNKYKTLLGTRVSLPFYNYYKVSFDPAAPKYNYTCSDLTTTTASPYGGNNGCVNITSPKNIGAAGLACAPGCAFPNGANSGAYGLIQVEDNITGPTTLLRNIVCHEFGHIMGLPHHNNGTGEGCVGNYTNDNNEHNPTNNTWERNTLIQEFTNAK